MSDALTVTPPSCPVNVMVNIKANFFRVVNDELFYSEEWKMFSISFFDVIFDTKKGAYSSS